MTDIRVVLVLRGSTTVFDRGAPVGARRLAERAAVSGRVEAEDAGGALWLASRVLGPQGEPFVVVGVLAGPGLHGVVPPPRGPGYGPNSRALPV